REREKKISQYLVGKHCDMIWITRIFLNSKARNLSLCNSKIARRLISIGQHIEEKKKQRLLSIRNAVLEIYNTSDRFEWNEIRNGLDQRSLRFSSNLEFVLISAFDQNQFDEQIDQSLFLELVRLIQQSETIKSNKIAAIRFCVFLGSFSNYLKREHLEYIRSNAETIANDPNPINQIIIDIVEALAASSPQNCQYAIELLPKFIKSFNLKLILYDIIFKKLIQHNLSTQTFRFLCENIKYLEADENQIERLILLIVNSESKDSELIESLKIIGEFYHAINLRSEKLLIENLLNNRLGYSRIIQDAKIDSKSGRCECCGQILKGLNSQEFQLLKTYFKSIIFDHNDNYLIENLDEHRLQLKNFESKILPDGKHKNYDLILDGLNLSYRRSKSVVKDQTGLRQYAKVYKTKDIDNQIVQFIQDNQLIDRFEKILLIGREHMSKWSKLRQLCKTNREKIDLQLLFNQTLDDNFILYAAIQHPTTLILSTDQFRDHANKFNDWYRNVEEKNSIIERPNLRRLFLRWLRSRQIKIDGKYIRYPDNFDLKIHSHRISSSNNRPTFHIPVIQYKNLDRSDDDIIRWICASFK
ncbi:hypothetical protein SSS_05195, partial [Sarcoptes scabiei]